GLHFILSHSGGCARKAGLPPASVLSPTSWAQNSSGFQPDKFQFVGRIGASSKMLLMFLLLTKSSGHTVLSGIDNAIET
ncbi:MAG: hypothetical protein IJN23_02200, partial [Akkermansia sp.]|nr:hypothetical protein [Akkermansia sp.]